MAPVDEEVGCTRCRGERGRAREGGAWARGRGRALNGMRVAGDRVLVCEPLRISGPGEVLGGGGGGEGGHGNRGNGPPGVKRSLDRFRGVGAGFGVQREEEVRRSGIRTPPGLPGRGPGYGGTKLAAITESEGEEVAQSMDGVADGNVASDEAVADSESSFNSGSGSSVETVIARSLARLESLDARVGEDDGADVDMGMDHRGRSLSSDATIDGLDSQNGVQVPGSLSAATGDLEDSEMADIDTEGHESLSSAGMLDDESADSEIPDIYAHAHRILRAQLDDLFSGDEVWNLAGRGR